MKLPDTVRSMVLLVVTVVGVVGVWPKYQTYAMQEMLEREDIRIRKAMVQAVWVNESLKDKPYYLEWLRAQSGN